MKEYKINITYQNPNENDFEYRYVKSYKIRNNIMKIKHTDGDVSYQNIDGVASITVEEV